VNAFLILAAFATALLSGIFGMAGGLVLMGFLAMMLPVQAAFVTHGILQLVANGWRAVLHREHINWRILGWYALASAAAALIVFFLAFVPSKPVLFILLGLVPLLIWLPKDWIALDASNPPQAFLSGLLVTGLNLTAGVAGPLLDIFFVRSGMNRHQVVSTKAATQVFAHLAKIIVFGAPLLSGGGADMPPAWVIGIAIPASMLGTALGGRVLDRMNDTDFRRWTEWIVTGIGLVYLGRGLTSL
jgi:uncharacterized membrane protein YfcA